MDIVNNITEFKPLSKNESMLRVVEGEHHDYNVLKFQKKAPLWSEKKQAYV